MKPSRYTFFTSLLCASGLSGGLCFCIITSFSVPADRLLLACACVLAALFFLLTKRLFHGKILLASGV